MGELHIKKIKKKSENLLRSPKSPIFGTKLDFFPIGTFQIPNVPNFNKFIWSKLHIKKKNNKNLRTFFDDKNPQFSELKWIFFQLEHSKSQMFQISINLFGLSFILKKNNKNRRTLFDDKNPQFSELKWIFFQLEHSKSKIFEISNNLFDLSFIS